ncbi:MAG: acetate/propionate family kinase [Pseudomonadota bacterium]|nr:acetate/propionate family kinase [Pseudomonadota bacterium]
MPMPPPGATILAVNAGSSNIKFALFRCGTEPDAPPEQLFDGCVDGIGTGSGCFSMNGVGTAESFSRHFGIPEHFSAARVLMDWLGERLDPATLAAIGHRVVHGGPDYWAPQQLTVAMRRDLHQLTTFDPEHMPLELLLIDELQRKFPAVPQFACFDTAFHHAMPRVAQMLPIPRRYEALGVRRYGFHGLSCAWLVDALARQAGTPAAHGRVILAHLGGGASITAVRDGLSVDTSMGLTPAGGLPMASRSGDLDPGLALYLARTEQSTPAKFNHMVNHDAGLLGVSETSGDMRVLLASQADDIRAAEAVTLFCYQAMKTVCAMAGVLAGVDTLVFAGGIGEHAPEVRARICASLGWLGIALDPQRNAANATVISSDASAVCVRVIHTDEQRMIAQQVRQLLERSGA